jgi:hypothetical protein
MTPLHILSNHGYFVSDPDNESGNKRELNKKNSRARSRAHAHARESATTDDLPDWMPIEAWQGFVDMRRRIRAPLTARAVSMIVRRLDNLRQAGFAPEAVLDQSTANAWRGVFPLSDRTGRELANEQRLGRDNRNSERSRNREAIRQRVEYWDAVVAAEAKREASGSGEPACVQA